MGLMLSIIKKIGILPEWIMLLGKKKGIKMQKLFYPSIKTSLQRAYWAWINQPKVGGLLSMD